MKPRPFHYLEPASSDEALALLADHGPAARILAGGQSLVPLMNMRLVHPQVLIDVNRLAALEFIRQEDGALVVGALTRHYQLESSQLARSVCPLVSEAVRWVGYPAIRMRGTFGGSLAHADPTAELPLVFVCLGGTATLAAHDRTRTVAAADLLRGPFTTAIAPAELLIDVRLPAMPATAGYAFQEYSRRYGGAALVAVAAVMEVEASGKVASARLGIGGVGPTPIRLPEEEALLAGAEPTEEAFHDLAQRVASRIDPGSDVHASAAFRRQLARALVARVLTDSHASALARRAQ
jgi:CO/xanthine dehydrogenase FAD-binding subunit